MPTNAYLHTCDASAAVRLGASSRFVAASDEDYILRVYDAAAPGKPISSTDLVGFLDPEVEGEEPDIEGSARIGDRIYWVTSHGLDSSGAVQESRRRFFATTATMTGGTVQVEPLGQPYSGLLDDLQSAPDLAPFELGDAASIKPEEPGGLNLEGMAPTTDGRVLLGFRNPIPEGLALIVALHNPADLVDGRAESAVVSLAGRLDLGGRGIRALEFVAEVGIYLVLAGSFNDVRDFRLYQWSGELADPGTPLTVDFQDCNPEELIVTEVRGNELDVEFFSDDGDRLVGNKKCKKLNNPELQSFRSIQAVVKVDVDLEPA